MSPLSGELRQRCRRGQKLADSFVSNAIQTACAFFGFTTRFAMLAPDADTAGLRQYALFVEGRPPEELATRLESELRNNPHYALCRDLGQLGPLRCFEVGGGAYEVFCQAAISEGRRLGDIKPQTLSLRTDWRERFSGRPNDTRTKMCANYVQPFAAERR